MTTIRLLMSPAPPREVWADACRKAKEYVEAANSEDAGDMAIDVARELLAVAHQLKGVACSACNGRGTLTCGDTEDVCARCWGIGRADKIGPDFRLVVSACESVIATANGNSYGLTDSDMLEAMRLAARECEAALGEDAVKELLQMHR